MRRNIEKKIYEYLGVNIFRKVLLLLDSFLKIFHVDMRYKINNKTIEGLKDFRKGKVALGIVHIEMISLSIGILFINPVYWLFYVILNIYCVMLQRYDYIRVDEIIKKYEQRKSKQVVTNTENQEDTQTDREQVKSIQTSLIKEKSNTEEHRSEQLTPYTPFAYELISTAEELPMNNQETCEKRLYKRL